MLLVTTPAPAANGYPWRRAAGIFTENEMLDRFILSIRQDFGCFVIVVAFLVLMVSTILFANILTPNLNGSPYV